MKRRWPLAWRASLRRVGFIPVPASIVGIILLHIIIAQDSPTWYSEMRVVEMVLPFTFALHVAFMFSPTDEPPLEVLLGCSRPVSWVIWERLAIVTLLHGVVALVATGYSLTLPGAESLLVAISRWAVTAAMFGAVALAGTFLTRLGVFGVMVVVPVWLGWMLNGDGLVTRWPFLQPIHPYLQPDSVSGGEYALNRLLLLLLAALLLAMTVRVSRDEEHLLGLRAWHLPSLVTGLRARLQAPKTPSLQGEYHP